MENLTPTPITTSIQLLEQSSSRNLTVSLFQEPASPTSSQSTCSLFSQTNVTTYDPKQGIEVPDPKDVICGRGKMTVDHPGNRRFRQLVSERKESYQQAKRRDDKTRITCELVQAIRCGPDGGRFLLFDPTTKLWYEVGEEYAREKVSHSLRQRNRPSSESRRSSTATKPKSPRKKTVRKTQFSPALDLLVKRLIEDQQQLLKTMIENETTSSPSPRSLPRSSSSSSSSKLLSPRYPRPGTAEYANYSARLSGDGCDRNNASLETINEAASCYDV